MKRLTCTLATLALVMATSIPARAEFKGTFQRDVPWMLEITSASFDNITATVCYLGRNLEVIELVTVQPGTTVQVNIPKPGRGVRRVVVDVDLPFPESLTEPPVSFARIRMVQGGLSFIDVITSSGPGDTHRFVFNVVDSL